MSKTTGLLVTAFIAVFGFAGLLHGCGAKDDAPATPATGVTAGMTGTGGSSGAGTTTTPPSTPATPKFTIVGAGN